MLVAICEINGNAAVLTVHPKLNFKKEVKKGIPAGLDYWIVEEIEMPEALDDPSITPVEPQMSDFGITVGVDEPDGIGEGAPI